MALAWGEIYKVFFKPRKKAWRPKWSPETHC